MPLPGEAAGVLLPRGRPWVAVETASASFGQGISVTALQLATAYSTLANDGVQLAPFHDLDSQVPAELKSELEQIKKDIQSGKIKVLEG